MSTPNPIRLATLFIFVAIAVFILLSANYTAVSPLNNTPPTPNHTFTIPDPEDTLICAPEDKDNILLPSCHANVLRDYLPPQELHAMSNQPCQDGMAGIYPCHNIDLLSFMPLAQIGGGNGNDIWGWTDPQTGKEYAIMGRNNGTAFVDISDPYNPIYLGNLPTQTSNSLWRDIKTFDNHAFIVSEASGHGMQVFNLTQLRHVVAPPQTFTADAHYNQFGPAHNIVINEDSGYAYVVGARFSGTTCNGGLHMIDINDPTNPSFAGCFSADGYTHDAQCVIYQGPDESYQGQEICFNSNENTVTIVDVTNKNNPSMISRTSYFGYAYTHQGWLTTDHSYFLVNDELDEQHNNHNTRTYIWNVSDLENPFLIGYHNGRTPAIDHNLYITDNKVYQANYRSGLSILELGNLDLAELTEIGYFDIYPSDTNPNFNGAWSNYPFFESGIVIVSGIEQGLFVLKLVEEDDPTPTPTATILTPTAIMLTPTPTATPLPESQLFLPLLMDE